MTPAHLQPGKYDVTHPLRMKKFVYELVHMHHLKLCNQTWAKEQRRGLVVL